MHKRTLDEFHIIWIYAGVFAGWWCYDNIHNIKINRIYKDYCMRNNINNDINLKQSTDPLTTMPKIMSKKNLSVFEPVNFDCNTSVYTDDGDDFDYIINTQHGDFRIDFENMRQIDVSNHKKQRNIKQIYVPHKIYINNTTFVKYMKKYDVRGISGKKFD